MHGNSLLDVCSDCNTSLCSAYLLKALELIALRVCLKFVIAFFQEYCYNVLMFTPASEITINLCLETQVFKEKKPSRETFVCGACGQVRILSCLLPGSLLVVTETSF